MKRFSLLFLSLFLLATALNAKQVDLADAQNIAMGYLTKNSPKHILGVSNNTPQLQLALEAKSKTNATDYFVFNNGSNNGYIIVAGDDRAVPVLGYSDEGSFDPSSMPDGLRYMLEVYSQEMQYLRSNPNALAAEPSLARNPEVKPLLTCNWGQTDPFNRQCPTYTTKEGEVLMSATGCVATAAAQVMYYHRWPDVGVGSNTYELKDERELYADFAHPFDWDNIISNYIAGKYTDEQANAVARLMSDCGIACNMQYGSSSSASAHWMMDGMRKFFKYNKGMKFAMRGTKTITEWEELIFNELNNKRPILYSGFAQTGGHSFVLDGYNAEGYYHFNWGWTSRSNGYFVITSLNPRDQGTGSWEGGYNSAQSMILNAYPDNGDPEPESYLEITIDKFEPTKESVTLGESVAIDRYGMMGAGHGYGRLVDITTAFVLTDQNNNIVEVYPESERNLTMSLGTRYTNTIDRNNARKITPSTSLANGDYRLHFMYKSSDADIEQYRPYDHSATTTGYWNAHVENGQMVFTEAKVGNPNLSVESFDYPQEVGDNTFFNATMKLTNTSDEYNGPIRIAVKKTEATQYDNFFVTQVDIPKNGNLLVKCELFPPRGSGSYQLIIRDEHDNTIGGPYPLTLAPNEGYDLEAVSQLTVGDYYMTPDNINATINIKNIGTGEYVGPIYYRIMENGNNRLKGNSEVVKIAAGETRTINFKTVFEGLPDTEYNFNVYPVKGDESLTNAKFQLKIDATAIDEITVEGNHNVRYVNPMGQVSDTPFKGINIVIDGDKVYKVIK